MFHFLREDIADFVDVEDRHRARVIRESEYWARAEAESQILRISGKVRPPDAQPLKALVVMERG
jgi:hypothetical protein